MASGFSNTSEREITPFQESAISGSTRLSRRGYNLLMGGLIFLGFVVVAAGAMIASSTGFLMAVLPYYLPVMIGSTIISIAGIFVLSAGMKREGLGLPLLGYAMVICSLGFTTGMVLPFYSLPSIVNAFVGTVLFTALFTLLGASFPQFFARAIGIVSGLLLGLLLVMIIGFIAGIPMGWLDYVLLVLFAGFVGFDTYQANQAEPTAKMAIFFALNIWLDLINVFMIILRIVGGRDN